MKALLLTLAACLIVSPVHAKYSGGTGEPNDPYQIATAEDLIALGERFEDYDKHFILTADIDLDPNLPGRKVFDKALIAPDVDGINAWYFDGISFTGVFDGNGHKLRNYRGSHALFGCVWGATAEVKNLGLIKPDVVGDDARSLLVGELRDGTVSNCEVQDCNLTNRAYMTGGLVCYSQYLHQRWRLEI